MRSADPTLFRQLLGRFATGVTVATTVDAAGHPVGMTASAVAAVSLEPPLVLVCVSPAADSHGALEAAPVFALNILTQEQVELSRRFADEHADRFDGVAFTRGPGGVPLLAGALAHVVCTRWGQYANVGDHTVFIGLVTEGATFEGRPLVHYRSDYTTTADGT